MPNHGYCRNCWWWMPPSPDAIPTELFKSCVGKCYMESDANFSKYTTPTSYCPDYINRKKEDKNGTLEDWIKQKLL